MESPNIDTTSSLFHAAQPLVDVYAHATSVSLPTGHRRAYVNLDNAATTPPAVQVVQAVGDLMAIYGSVQRGAGIKALATTEVCRAALEVIRCFVGASPDDLVVTASNTTTAINRLAMSYHFDRGDIVLVSAIEHSSNYLPWARHATVIQVESTTDGALDLDHLDECLRRYGRRARLLALTGASNVTGYLPPVREATRMAHHHGAEVFLDCAQLVAHRPLAIRSTERQADPDYIAFSGHKMYAPYGSGVLIGRRERFERTPPDLPGGGTVDLLGRDGVVWAAVPARMTPGTPNVVGLVAMAAAAQLLRRLDNDRVLSHEQSLCRLAVERLPAIDGITLHGQNVFQQSKDRLPLFPFTSTLYHHSLLAAILSHEYAIGVRAGHLCQYEFMRRTLRVSEAEQRRLETLVTHGDKSLLYGMVRASCGLSNSVDDLTTLLAALEEIQRRGPVLAYEQDVATGEFKPIGSLRSWVTDLPASLASLLAASKKEEHDGSLKEGGA